MDSNNQTNKLKHLVAYLSDVHVHVGKRAISGSPVARGE